MDGTIVLYPASVFTVPRTSFEPESVDTTKSKVICRAHLSLVTSIKFFPSSRVILSSGQDLGLPSSLETSQRHPLSSPESDPFV